MSSIGLPFTSSNRIPSQAIMNVKTNIVGTGDEILALTLQDPRDIGTLASCKANSTGNALLANHIYQWTGTAGGWKIKSQSPHTHEDVNTGGSFKDVIIKAIKNLYYVNMPTVTKERFYTNGTGGTYTNTISGTDAYVELSTGTTTNNAANLILGGQIVTFTQPIKFNCRLKLVDKTTNFLGRIGINAEFAQAITDNLNKIGFEACTSCNGTNNQIFSSNGTRTKHNVSDLATAVANYSIELEVGANVHYYKDANTVVSKTTNVPSTGTSVRSNTLVSGVQTTNTTATKQQLFFLHAVATQGESNLP